MRNEILIKVYIKGEHKDMLSDYLEKKVSHYYIYIENYTGNLKEDLKRTFINNFGDCSIEELEEYANPFYPIITDFDGVYLEKLPIYDETKSLTISKEFLNFNEYSVVITMDISKNYVEHIKIIPDYYGDTKLMPTEPFIYTKYDFKLHNQLLSSLGLFEVSEGHYSFITDYNKEEAMGILSILKEYNYKINFI